MMLGKHSVLKETTPWYLLLFVTIATVGGSFSIGQYGIYILLLIFAVIQCELNILKKRRSVLPLNNVGIYLVYIIVFWICSMFNGDGDMGRISLTINYIICLVMYLMLGQMVNSKNKVNDVINLFIGILLFDCMVTILQFHNIAFGWGIWFFFNDADKVEQSDLILNLASGSQVLGDGELFCPGLFPTQVYNGYIVASLGVFVLYKSQIPKKLLVYKIFHIVMLAVVVYSLFVIQQRMAFVLFLFVFVIVYFSRYKALTIIVALSVALFYICYGFNLDENLLGRYSDLHDETRSRLYETGIDYVLNHLMLGGRAGYLNLNNLSVHNVFLNAFLYGGIVGALLIIVIFFKMCGRAGRIIINSIHHDITPATAFAYSLLIYNLISLVHNNSLLTGEPIIWILYALMIISYRFENAK